MCGRTDGHESFDKACKIKTMCDKEKHLYLAAAASVMILRCIVFIILAFVTLLSEGHIFDDCVNLTDPSATCDFKKVVTVQSGIIGREYEVRKYYLRVILGILILKTLIFGLFRILSIKLKNSTTGSLMTEAERRRPSDFIPKYRAILLNMP